MMDREDDLLRELGQETPFPVDWDVYREQLTARLAKADASRRLRALGLFAVGTMTGIAATLAIVLQFAPGFEGPPLVPEVKEAGLRENRQVAEAPLRREQEAPVVEVVSRRTGNRGYIRAVVGKATYEAPVAQVQPFVRRIGKGEIRFDGFSEPGADQPGFAVAKIGN